MIERIVAEHKHDGFIYIYIYTSRIDFRVELE